MLEGNPGMGFSGGLFFYEIFLLNQLNIGPQKKRAGANTSYLFGSTAQITLKESSAKPHLPHLLLTQVKIRAKLDGFFE